VEPRINEQLVSPRKPLTRLKSSYDQTLRREDASFARPNLFSPKVSNEDIKSIQVKAASLQSRSRSCQDSFRPFLCEAQRWGQVSCPLQFSGQARENSNLCVPMFREDSSDNNHAHSQSDQFVSSSLLPKASSLGQDLTEIDKMLSEELKRLHAEVICSFYKTILSSSMEN